MLLYTAPVPVKTTTGCGFSRAQLIWSGAFALGTIVAVLLLALFQLGLPLRIAASLLAVVPGVVYIVVMVRDVRRLDELQQRIFLEAAAVALAGAFLCSMLYPTLHKAGLVPDLSPAAMAVVIVALATVGYAIAKRRYE